MPTTMLELKAEVQRLTLELEATHARAKKISDSQYMQAKRIAWLGRDLEKLTYEMLHKTNQALGGRTVYSEWDSG